MAWRQFLRLLPIRLVLSAADAIARCMPVRHARAKRLPPWRPGITVLIPECGTPAVLAGTLDALAVASANVAERVNVRVVVNGAPRGDYRELVARHGAVAWRFVTEPLGFSGAVEAGLDGIADDWVYLLNSDMQLDEAALRHILACRADDVFGIASSLSFADRGRRREETGYTAWAPDGLFARPHDVEPDRFSRRDRSATPNHLYAGGGASLFRTTLLRRYVRDTRCYRPFYFEDADWGIAAWRDGWRVRFCAASKATHAHRATIGRWDALEIERIIDRNLWWLEARQSLCGTPAATLYRDIERRPAATQRELAALSPLWSLFRSRIRARRTAPLPALAPGFVSMPARSGGERSRPCEIHVATRPIVDAFALDWLAALASECDIVLIAAQADRYAADAWRTFAFCHAIRFVGGDPLRCIDSREDLVAVVREAVRHFGPSRVVVDAVNRRRDDAMRAAQAACVASISISRSERQMSPSTTT